MKKKIKAVIMAIMIVITTFFSNIMSVSATIPGVVQAENVWLTLETLAFSLGVNLPFIPDKSISYNNNQRKQEIIDSIDKQLSDGVITQQQHDDAIQQLDDMLVLPGQYGVGSAISIGEQLWGCLTRFFYDNYIKSSPNLVTTLNPDALDYFNSYSGTCAIYSIFASNNPAQTSIVVFSDGAYESPVYKGQSYGSSVWEIAYKNAQYYYMLSDGTLDITSGYTTRAFFGQGINVQYIPDKGVNEVITNDNENALVSGSYSEYTDKLSEIYSVVNGQVVVTDTGEAPVVLDGDTLDNVVADVNDGTLTWENSIPQLFSQEDTGDIDQNTPVIGKKALDEMVTSLNLDRLKTKFPFCIPNDLMLIMNGATAVSSNQAPVIEIPLKIEFNDHVYYDNDSAVVIDFNDFSGVVHIFREGFFLLFLIALLWVSIEILQAFFVVTE